jgi:glycosyltransferase involved in cell wall biosynthesis
LLKGVQFLLEAFADPRLARATLTLVGGGPEAERLKQQAEELGISNRLEWKGPVARELLGGVYAAHDVLMAPSLYESGGLAVLEAMEHGLPAVVLDVGGHAVSITKDCGVKISSELRVAEVIRSLADAMHGYAVDPKLRLLHGNAARERATLQYRWGGKVTRMKRIYNEVLQSRDERIHR